MDTTEIGNIGYAKTITKFTELGIPVFIPFCEGSVIDLIAYFGGKLNKIQVKTTRKVHKNSLMKFKISHQDGFHGGRKKYSSEEVDYFALYCIENDKLFLVPIEQCQGYGVTIRLSGTNKINSKISKFDIDYTFDNIVKL